MGSELSELNSEQLILPLDHSYCFEPPAVKVQTSLLAPQSLVMVCFLPPDAGHPTSAGHVEAAENDDGADSFAVHVRLWSSHSVSQKF